MKVIKESKQKHIVFGSYSRHLSEADTSNGIKSFHFEFTVDGLKSAQDVSAASMQKAEELIKKQYDEKAVIFTKKETKAPVQNEDWCDDEFTEKDFDKDIDVSEYDDDFGESNIEKFGEHQDSQKDIPATPEVGPDTGISNLLITAINGEWDTIKLYNDIITTASDVHKEEIIKTIQDITAEENAHVGQLQKLLAMYSPNVSKIAEGESEAQEQIDDSNKGV